MKGNKAVMRFSRELPFGERQYFAGGHSSSLSSRLKAAASKLDRVLPLQRYALFSDADEWVQLCCINKSGTTEFL